MLILLNVYVDLNILDYLVVTENSEYYNVNATKEYYEGVLNYEQ